MCGTLWLCVYEELLWRLEILHSLSLYSVKKAVEVHGWRKKKSWGYCTSVIKGTFQCSVGQPKQGEGLYANRCLCFFTSTSRSEMNSFLRWWKAIAWVNKAASCLLWGTFGQETNSKRICFLWPVLSHHFFSTVPLVRKNWMTWK